MNKRCYLVDEHARVNVSWPWDAPWHPSILTAQDGVSYPLTLLSSPPFHWRVSFRPASTFYDDSFTIATKHVVFCLLTLTFHHLYFPKFL